MNIKNLTTMPLHFVRGRKNVFLDWQFIEPGYGIPFWKFYQEKHGLLPWLSPYGIELKVMRPEISVEPFVQNDPLGFIGAYSTLIHEDGLYRLWYATYDFNEKGQEFDKLCYMESSDGKNWRRSQLGLYPYKGSKDNNIVYGLGPKECGGHIGAHGATVFIDPYAIPEERYKMVHLGPSDRNATLSNWLYGATSHDGIRWNTLPEPILKYTSDTQSIGLFDEEIGKYVIYLRGWSPQNRYGSGGRRMIRRTESSDFRRFPPPKPLISHNPSWGVHTDIYTNSYHKWPGADNAHIMLPALYHRDTDTVDVHLALSRDANEWFLPQSRPLISNEDRPDKITIYTGSGIVPYGKDLWAFPVFFSRRAHNEYTDERPALYLATIRQDGLIAVESNLKGEFYTYPCIFDGSSLNLNAVSYTGGEIKVEILQVKPALELSPIEGFTLDLCDRITGSALWQMVSWRGNPDISTLAGRILRFRFVLVRSRLHAFRFE
ncbi:MAG: hypothetical protein HQL06_10600 [Nitrospirae bacterium]|nr:hypothetical protein [Nitrospirota bacterium]